MRVIGVLNLLSSHTQVPRTRVQEDGSDSEDYDESRSTIANRLMRVSGVLQNGCTRLGRQWIRWQLDEEPRHHRKRAGVHNSQSSHALDPKFRIQYGPYGGRTAGMMTEGVGRHILLDLCGR